MPFRPRYYEYRNGLPMLPLIQYPWLLLREMSPVIISVNTPQEVNLHSDASQYEILKPIVKEPGELMMPRQCPEIG